jgi:hypothetical protein
MKRIIAVIFFFLLAISMTGCNSTFYNYKDNSSQTMFGDPQFQYGGQFTVKYQATHGVNP